MTSQVNFVAPNIASFLPNDYFSHSHAPVISIIQEKDETGSLNYFKNHTTILHGNSFVRNKHYQALLFSEQ